MISDLDGCDGFVLAGELLTRRGRGECFFPLVRLLRGGRSRGGTFTLW